MKKIAKTLIACLTIVVFVLATAIPAGATVDPASQGPGPKMSTYGAGGYALIENDSITTDDSNRSLNVIPVIPEASLTSMGQYRDKNNGKVAISMPTFSMYPPGNSTKALQYRVCIYAPTNKLHEIAEVVQFGIRFFEHKNAMFFTGAISCKIEERNTYNYDYVSFFPDDSIYMSSEWKQDEDVFVGGSAGLAKLRADFSAWSTKPVEGEFRMLLLVRFVQVPDNAAPV